MSLRHLALYAVVAGLSIYAWKDWFKSLCGLILMMAVIHHEDMPTTMMGIQGLNPWNMVFISTLMAWIAGRHSRGHAWDMPRHVYVLLLMYLGVIVVGWFRAVFDRSHIESYPLGSLISEELINTIKWVLPGILLFDGCRTRHRVRMALTCILVMYFLVSVQVINRVPFESAFGGDSYTNRMRLKACNSVGYSACDTSTMLAGISWAIIATLTWVKEKKHQLLLLTVAGIVTLGQALTGGRAGYVAWGVTGLVMCLLKWRKYLILAPVLMILLPVVFPGAFERMCSGFGEIDAAGRETVDEDELGSGRFALWPIVISKIEESPLLGYGRLAMQRTGLYDFTAIELEEAFPHPHNMYLETLIDNGMLGSIPIWVFWGMILLYSARLFRSDNRLYTAVGALALSTVMAQLVAGMGAQHFYPRESTTGMWAAVFLALRVYVEEKRAQMTTPLTDTVWDTQVTTPLQEHILVRVGDGSR